MKTSILRTQMKFSEIIVVIIFYCNNIQELQIIEDYIYYYLEDYNKNQLKCMFDALEVKTKRFRNVK